MTISETENESKRNQINLDVSKTDKINKDQITCNSVVEQATRKSMGEINNK